MTLHERLIEIEKKYKMTPREVALLLDIPYGTYYIAHSGTRNTVTHWQRIALDFLLSEGPKKYAKLTGAR